MMYGEEEEEEVQYAENEFQISKEQFNYNKNQKGWYLKHQQAVSFSTKEYNEELIGYMQNEYNIKSEVRINLCIPNGLNQFSISFLFNQHSKQVFGIQESNTIRYKKNQDVNLRFQPIGSIESNAKIVEWDDGSFHLMIGDQFFKLINKDFQAECCSLYERPNNMNQNSFLTDQIIPQGFVDKVGTIQKANK